ncbi:MAG: RsiV family protein [Oscillospiraceae bacterium]
MFLKLHDLWDRLQTKASDFGLFDEYESIVEERFQPSALATQVDYWYFSDTGLVIFFNPYDILPYAAGVVKIEFSYEDLSEFLKSEFIPVALNSDAQAPAPILRFPANTDMEAYQTVEYVDAATTDSDVTFAMYGSNTVYNLSRRWYDWVGSGALFCGNLSIQPTTCPTPIWSLSRQM